MSENIVLVKNAFEETPATSPVLTPTVPERTDLVEIGTLFDTIAIPDSIVHIAKTNELNLTWKELQTILNSLIAEQYKLIEDKVQDETTKTMVDSLTTNIAYTIKEHKNCPFTIQRLCELMIEPKKYYKMYVKYLRAIDKVLSVTSYWEDYVNTEKTIEEEPSLPNDYELEETKQETMEETKEEAMEETIEETTEETKEETIDKTIDEATESIKTDLD